MSAKLLPYTRPSTEEKVRRLEDSILWRVRIWRWKRAAAYYWPYAIVPACTLLLLWEFFR